MCPKPDGYERALVWTDLRGLCVTVRVGTDRGPQGGCERVRGSLGTGSLRPDGDVLLPGPVPGPSLDGLSDLPPTVGWYHWEGGVDGYGR